MQARGPRPAVPPQQQAMGGLNPQGHHKPGGNPSVASMSHSTERCRGAAAAAAAAGRQRWHGGRPGRTRPGPAASASGTLTLPAAMQQQRIQQQIGSQASQTLLGIFCAFLPTSVSPLRSVLSYFPRLRLLPSLLFSYYFHFRCHKRS
uniref:Uncharacterized protein n=1 Tax=Myotis myotis TaxID=51298 RepID=A0A7J7Z4P0_MYOMY|nr:hypothetical protein mMyoMyo1_010598 [Myotis myotis]